MFCYFVLNRCCVVFSGFSTLPISIGTHVSHVDINNTHTHIWSQLWVGKQQINQASFGVFDQKALERKLLGGQGASYCVGKDFQMTIIYILPVPLPFLWRLSTLLCFIFHSSFQDWSVHHIIQKNDCVLPNLLMMWKYYCCFPIMQHEPKL